MYQTRIAGPRLGFNNHSHRGSARISWRRQFLPGQRDHRSIAVSRSHVDNDFDHDFASASVPDNHEKQGLKGTPRYIHGAGFDPETRTGMFQLAPGSKGVDAGVVIPNFCEAINGNRPDLGAHESGTGKMQFGVRAQFAPRGTLKTTQEKPASKPDARDGL